MQNKKNALKIEELELRINALEKQKASQAYSQLDFSYDTSSISDNYVFSSDFKVLQSSNVFIKIDFTCSNASFNVDVKYNGVFVRSFSHSGESFSKELCFLAERGDGNLQVTISSKSSFEISSFNVRASGAVENANLNAEIKVLNLEECSFVLFRVANNVSLYTYDGTLKKVNSFTAKDCAFSVYSSRPLLALINEENTLIVYKLDLSGNLTGDEAQIDQKITSVCGAKGVYGYVLHAVKGNRVYTYNVDYQLNVSATRQRYYASKVIASANVENAFIVTDFNGNSNLICL